MRAGGLNFRDVLIALGMYPGEATLGSEGAGVVPRSARRCRAWLSAIGSWGC